MMRVTVKMTVNIVLIGQIAGSFLCNSLAACHSSPTASRT